MLDKCLDHPAAAAGWRCSECSALLCPDCAVRRISGTTQVPSCGHCGAFAHVVKVPRDVGPWSEVLEGIATYPVADGGWRVFVAGLVVMGTLRLMWLPGAGLANAFLAAYLFHVVRESGHGRADAPEFADFGDATDLAASAMKFGACIVLALVPAWTYALFLDVSFDLESLVQRAWDPLMWGLLLAGLAWSPMAIIYGAVDSPPSVIFHGGRAFESARRIGGDYARAVAAFWLLFAVRAALDELAERMLPGIPIVPGLLTLIPGLYLQIVAARVLGLLLYVHGGRLGYGRLDDYLEPALGRMQPTREISVKPASAHVATTASTEPVEPIQLSDEPFRPREVFQEWQPTDASHALELPETSRGTTISPPGREGRVPTDDLMSEEDFLNTVYTPKSR